MTARTKLSPEAKLLLREYAVRVTRKMHPQARIHVQVGDYADENGQVERTVTIECDDVESATLEIGCDRPNP